MGFLEAALALIGLVALVAVIVRWCLRPPLSDGLLEEDIAAPYREGLHAAVRLQTVAQELEQQLYTEALRHSEDEAGASDSVGQRP
jgi:hypothetical protein